MLNFRDFPLPVPPFLFWNKTWTGARCMRAVTGPLIWCVTTRAPTIALGGKRMRRETGSATKHVARWK